MRARHLAYALTATLLAALPGPAAAAGSYGDGAQIVSADFERLEQGDDKTDFAAISADSRYVAIQTLARNFFGDEDPDPSGAHRRGGIFRFDLTTRGLEKVADGSLVDDEDPVHPVLRRGAANAAISADGRYVAFSTGERLVATDVNDNVDVYVRDMDLPIGAAGAFDLVSALDGGNVPATYAPPEGIAPASKPGTDLSRAVSISADGQSVVFTTEAVSDLPTGGSVDVPAGQVLVRERAADTTTLVTAVRDLDGGGSGVAAMTEEPAGGARGAAISADGTTVAWTGGNAGAQTRFLGGENPDPSFLYYLWRRIGDGPSTPTRRLTGLADPDDPACPPDSSTLFDQSSTGPCYGPLTDQEANRSGIAAQIPALSADGRTVAFLTGAGPRPLAFTGPGLDLFVTEMTAGLSRKAATVELTRDTVGGDPATSPPLGSVAMAAGGRYLAVTTARTVFALPALQPLDEPRPVPGPRELYVIDLRERTLERVTRSWWGGDIDADVENGATISADGSRVAFASFAGNLFFGDANQRADAFVAERRPEQGTDLPSQPPGTGGPDATIVTSRGGPRIRVTARALAAGAIALTVSVPEAGGVKAVARARAGRPPKSRSLATATGRARGRKRSTVRLVLRIVSRYRAELRRREEIPSRVSVTYVAAQGGRRASVSRPIPFVQEPRSRTGGEARRSDRPDTER